MSGEPIFPGAIWEAAGYRVRIVDIRRDGRVICKRTAVPGPDKYSVGNEITVTPEQLRAAYKPTGDYDLGEAILDA